MFIRQLASEMGDEANYSSDYNVNPKAHARAAVCKGMASLVCLVSGPYRDERRKIAIRVAAIRRAKVGYRQIQRHNEMALSTPCALTF
jgi:hypothetical protein